MEAEPTATSEQAGEARPLPIRVLLVAEVRLYREGLQQVLEQHHDIEVVGAVGEAREAAIGIAALRPDIALLDLPAGPPAVRRLLDAAPEVKVVVIAIPEEEDEVLAWAEAGVSGYVSRAGSIEDLVGTISSVARGELRCPPRIAATLLRRVTAVAAAETPAIPHLTYRERQILDLIEQDLSNKEIARRLSIALPTVKNHVHNILAKLQVRGRGQALSALGRRYRVPTGS